MGAFKFATNKVKKVFNVEVSGSYSEQDAINFITEYNSQVAHFNPKEYTIVLNCRELNVSTQDVLPMLAQCFKLYQESGFNKVVFEIRKSAILKMQLNRVGKQTGLSNYEIIEVE